MKLGVFDSFWDNQPNHLPLLRLRTDMSEPKEFNLKKSIQLIDQILDNQTPDEIYVDLVRMLADKNWRPHLVAFVTVLKLDPPEQQKYIGHLWKCLCIGTWVSPQLLVTLSKIDFNFDEKSARILKDSGIEQFSAAYLSEGEMNERNFTYEITTNKILNTLRYLKERTYDQDIDDDNGGDIAKGWDTQLTELRRLGML